MNKLIFLLLAATLYSADIYAIGYYSGSDTLNVFALSGLRLRDKPGGAVIATAPYGSKITMQEQQPNDRLDTIENIPGHWAKAVWQGLRRVHSLGVHPFWRSRLKNLKKAFHISGCFLYLRPSK